MDENEGSRRFELGSLALAAALGAVGRLPFGHVDWLTCDEDGCIGICLDAGDKCLAHAGDDERDAALEQVAQTGKIDARGVRISSALLKKILDSTPRWYARKPPVTSWAESRSIRRA